MAHEQRCSSPAFYGAKAKKVLTGKIICGRRRFFEARAKENGGPEGPPFLENPQF